MAARQRIQHRFERHNRPSLRNWNAASELSAEAVKRNVTIDCGWGKLIFGHTFEDHSALIEQLGKEEKDRRDIAFYIRDPHVILALAPQELFLDPSHTYRLWLDQYRTSRKKISNCIIRKLQSRSDIAGMNDVYRMRKMTIAPNEFVWNHRNTRLLTYFVAEDSASGDIVGSVLGVDHHVAFQDVENGSSLWCLAVDPQANTPGIGEALVRVLAEHYIAKGRSFMDLSVLHDNAQAIRLYEKLGFKRVPVFCIKRKTNPVNEQLFTGPSPDQTLNPYAKIIVDEARRRGIAVEVLDDESGYFRLTFGGRSIVCFESLTDMTSAIAYKRCDNKRITSTLLRNHGVRVPAQQVAGIVKENNAFLDKYREVVVKPLDSEQGKGISVGVRTPDDLKKAVRKAATISDTVLLEEFVDGQDLRIVVVDFKVAAAAIRKPPEIVGTGQHTVKTLIEKQSRRRAAATGGESHIPLDEETERCVKESGFSLRSILPKNKRILVRKAANLHSGGTIHDVTPKLHPELGRAAEQAARLLNIPVVGFDFIVPSVQQEQYVIIEANERPGLANHEPQPLVEKFVDYLFPQTRLIRENN